MNLYFDKASNQYFLGHFNSINYTYSYGLPIIIKNFNENQITHISSLQKANEFALTASINKEKAALKRPDELSVHLSLYKEFKVSSETWGEIVTSRSSQDYGNRTEIIESCNDTEKILEILLKNKNKIKLSLNTRFSTDRKQKYLDVIEFKFPNKILLHDLLIEFYLKKICFIYNLDTEILTLPKKVSEQFRDIPTYSSYGFFSIIKDGKIYNLESFGKTLNISKLLQDEQPNLQNYEENYYGKFYVLRLSGGRYTIRESCKLKNTFKFKKQEVGYIS